MLILTLIIVELFSAQALRFASNEQLLHGPLQDGPGIPVPKMRKVLRRMESTSSVFRTAEKQQQHLEEGVLVFMPGASDGRISNVKKTIAWLQTQTIPTECLIYNYGKLSTPDDELLPCKKLDNIDGQWMDHFLQVPLNMTKMKHVLLVMDGIEVQTVDLGRMIKAMNDNDLVTAAPALYGKFLYPQMIPHLGFGRKVNQLEWHMDLFTRSNFACLQDLIDSKAITDEGKTTNNHFGWYVAEAMTVACPGNLGVIDVMKIRKFAANAYNKTEAYLEGQAWLNDHGWGSLSQPFGYLEPGEPLKGDLLPGDPQCDRDLSCVCPTTCEFD